ncbi:MAG TPA: glycine/betaine ABC transporter ATP-binding protein [Ruminococcaceae bacterium]|jgi:osmoprotectant transport system ATP-binding protein|nr:glycine/betaine ABC transporter ATP-binding protein [Oscillospiraceae bacterium]
MATAVEFRSVCKRFPKASYDAVSNVSLKINEGEIVTILGTSGCGKTTLLKMVNRLYEPDSGEILFFGQPIKQMNPIELRRKIGYVIQQVGLFPHMRIGENIATVPKILGWPKQKIEKRVDELLELVQLPAREFKQRYPHQLSGGQQQRVGLARALAADPAIMLLDEPFGAIDAITRRSLQDELLSIHRRFRKTFLFVTHDIHEAFRLADRVLILNAGKVQQFAVPAEICSSPANDFVKKLVDSAREEQLEWKRGVCRK